MKLKPPQKTPNKNTNQNPLQNHKIKASLKKRYKATITQIIGGNDVVAAG
jgi:hypothetical protein